MTSNDNLARHSGRIGSKAICRVQAVRRFARTTPCMEQSRGPGWKCLATRTERKKEYASHANSISPDRGGRPPMVGESFHPHARQYQVDLERGRGHCRGVV